MFDKILSSQEVIANLIKINSIQINPKQPFIFASGISSPVYCDGRLVISEPLFRDRLASTFAEKIAQKYIDVETIAGVATGSIAISAWVAEKLNLPMIYARKPKGYGHNKSYEGKLRKGQKVVVIEDAISTGTNCLEAIDYLRKNGAVVLGVFVIYSHNLQKSFDNFKFAKTEYTALSSFEDLLTFAQKSKMINLEEKKAMLEWQQDPENWKNQTSKK
jgi:orotate phosphoribosyltransferase